MIVVGKEMSLLKEELMDGCTIHIWMDYPAIEEIWDTGYSPKDT